MLLYCSRYVRTSGDKLGGSVSVVGRGVGGIRAVLVVGRKGWGLK